MFDNATHQTQDHINSDPQRTFNAADSVIKEPRKSWSLPTLERALLTVIGFFAYYLAFRSGRTFVEWQFGLTIVLAVIIAIVEPALLRENERVTSELNGKQLCSCFVCFIGTFILVGIALIPIVGVWLSGRTTYKLIAGLGGILIIFSLILYLENDRVNSQLSEEITEPRTFRHALTFLGLAIIVGGVGWVGGTATRMFIDTAMPKLTFL